MLTQRENTLYDAEKIKVKENTPYKCRLCEDTGFIVTEETISDIKYEYASICGCQKRKMALKRAENSGLDKYINTKTFDAYITDFSWQQKIKEKAMRYANNPNGWWFTSGITGSGKTHICTAIASELLKSGRELIYVIHPEVMRANKYDSNPIEWQRMINAEVLYLDDLFKFNPTEIELKLTFELLNARYVGGKTTIISSERGLKEISRIDSAIAGRIIEASKDSIVEIGKDETRNRRVMT